MKRRYLLLSIFALLMLPALWITKSANPQQKTGPAPAAAVPNLQEERAERRKAAFRKGRDLLARKGVPFDPDELLSPGWKERLKPVLDQMPELQMVRQGDAKLKGLQMAHTLYLPDNIELEGDTVILARYIVFLGRDVVIKGHYGLHIFTIEETRIANNFSRKRDRLIKASANLSPISGALRSAAGGHMTIELRGFGREEWLEAQRLKQTAQLRRKVQGVRLNHASPFQSSTGLPGQDASDAPAAPAASNGADGSPGANGDCLGALNGTHGRTGGNGGDGGVSHGYDAADGGEGGQAPPVFITATMGMSYTVSTLGGRGGNGGRGSNGASGGNGGRGARGGDGATCEPCSATGEPGRGGNGGNGGKGGNGGNGGKGGKGGRGGEAGYIDITHPPNYNLSNINASATGGPGGSGGAGGTGSLLGGAAGAWGIEGEGNPGFSCSDAPDGDPGWFLTAGNAGTNGAAGAGGQTGSGGSSYITYTEVACDSCGEPLICDQPWVYNSCECCCDDAQLSGSCNGSPILVDVSGNGFALTSAQMGVNFDLRGDGTAERRGWTTAFSDDAWLALDRNGNGSIDDGTELFGNFTPQSTPPAGEERQGFLALAEYDKQVNGGNGDGKISQSDSIFSSLRLWQDTNHNGVSEQSELRTLPGLGLATLDLKYMESKRVDEYGNRFRYRAKVKDVHGAQVDRWAWDVFLVSQP